MVDYPLLRQIWADTRIGRIGLPAGTAPMPPADELLPCRALSRIPVGADSVIAVLFPYRYWETDAPHRPPQRNISLYAAVPDYHTVVMGYLNEAADALAAAFPMHRFAAFTDNSPIPEVKTAARAGLGMQGDHSLLIHPKYGSFLFIGEIVTDMPLPATGSGKIPPCLQCGRCFRACPTQALDAARRSRSVEKCLSALTQQKRTDEEQELLIRKGELIWGCDTCQLVCPLNRDIPLSPVPEFRADIVERVTEENLPGLIKIRAFGFRGPKPLLRNMELFRDK